MIVAVAQSTKPQTLAHEKKKPTRLENADSKQRKERRKTMLARHIVDQFEGAHANIRVLDFKTIAKQALEAIVIPN